MIILPLFVLNWMGRSGTKEGKVKVGGCKYQSNDDDAYYCPPCNVERIRIAKEIDSKPRPQTKPTMSELQIFDSIAKAKGGKGNNFVNIRDLGIKL